MPARLSSENSEPAGDEWGETVGAVVRDAADELVAVCECVLPESVLRCLVEGGAAWSCKPEERSLALRFSDLSEAAEGTVGALVTVSLPVPFTTEAFAGTLDGAFAGVVDLTAFLTGSALSVSDSRGRFLVTIFACVPVLTPPKKLKGSEALGVDVDLIDLAAFAVAGGLDGCLAVFSALSDAFLGGLVPRGEGTFGFVSVSLRGLMLDRCVVEVILTGLCTGLSFDLVVAFTAAELSCFFERAAAFESTGASDLTLEIALSFLDAVLATDLSDVNGFGLILLSLDVGGASLAEESRLSVVTGRTLGAGLRGSFLDVVLFFREESSFTSPSSSSSEL